MQRFTSLSGKKLLDFGSGSGSFCGYIKEKKIPLDFYQCDPSKSSISRSNELFRFDESKISTDINIMPNDFDIITSWYVYAYVSDQKGCWNILNKKLKSGGWLFVEVDNEKSLYCRLTKSKLDPNWSIKLDEVPSELKFTGRYPTPLPTHVFGVFDSKKPLLSLFARLAFMFIERLFRMPEHYIYVFRKNEHTTNN